VPPQEHEQLAGAIAEVAGVAEQYLDLSAMESLARQAPVLGGGCPDSHPSGTVPIFARAKMGLSPSEMQGASVGLSPSETTQVARIGVFRDAAFQFYYPENLEALAREGARLIEISPLRDAALPEVDALYIGGGFPETQAPALAENKPFLDSLRRSIENGLPVYAECGGAVYLGQKLLYQQREYPLAAVLPVVFAFASKPQGHGYTMLETVASNPFYGVGDALRGHEFHYTYMQSSAAKDLRFAFRVSRGFGFDGQRDGLCIRNVLASYMHVHALGTESWAPSLVRAAVRFRSGGCVIS
jgi:cobyrinic acid a,c-diamide synthase